MRTQSLTYSLLPHSLLLLYAATGSAANLNLAIDRGLFSPAADTLQSGPVSSGLDLALQNSLFDASLDYEFQVDVNSEQPATDEDTIQRVGTSLNSRLLNRLLGGQAKLNTNSVFHSTTGAYNHRVTPAYSRKLRDLATLNVNYQYLLNRPSAEAAEQEQYSYSFGLNGSLQGGRLNWSGIYSAADTYRDNLSHIQSSESFRIQSNYRLIPQMQLQLTSAITEKTQFRQRLASSFIQTQYGAGLSWQPSTHYALDVSVNQTGVSHTGEETLVRQGSVSWFPRQDLTLSLNYGDQLIEGARGVQLNTRLLLNRF